MNVLRTIPMLSVMGIIFFLSHQTFEGSVSLFAGADKVAHLVIYAFLASTIFYGLSPEVKNRPLLAMALVILITTFYGASDEFHQSFVPGRQPDLADWVADGIGALLVCIVWYVSLYKRQH